MLPSAKILEELNEKKLEFHSFALELSAKHKGELMNHKLDEETETKLKQLGRESFNAVKSLEASKEETLEEYIKNYLNS